MTFFEDIGDFIRKVPPFTRYYLGISIFISILVTFYILPEEYASFSLKGIFLRLQVWRIITSFFFLGSANLGFIFQISIYYMGLKNLEALFARQKYH